MLHRVYAVSFASVAALGVLTGCGGGGSTTGSNNNGNNNSANATVQALPTLAFSPTNVTVPVGGTVAFAFGSVGHTVTFTAGQTGAPGDIGTAASPNVNTTVIRSFSTAGTFYYHCSIHPTMTGVVFVGSTGVDTSYHGGTDTSSYHKDTTTTGGYGLRSGN